MHPRFLQQQDAAAQWHPFKLLLHCPGQAWAPRKEGANVAHGASASTAPPWKLLVHHCKEGAGSKALFSRPDGCLAH